MNNYVCNGYSSEFSKEASLVEKEQVSTVPCGVNENYNASNQEINSSDSRIKSLASLSSGMRGPTTNGVGADGGVVVDNKGNAPCHSSKHPTLPKVNEKCNIGEINKGRQRKTGVYARNSTTSAVPEQSRSAPAEGAVPAAPASVFRFPPVEKLIRKYTAMIAEQKERATVVEKRHSRSKMSLQPANNEDLGPPSHHSSGTARHNEQLKRPVFDKDLGNTTSVSERVRIFEGYYPIVNSRKALHGKSVDNLTEDMCSDTNDCKELPFKFKQQYRSDPMLHASNEVQESIKSPDDKMAKLPSKTDKEYSYGSKVEIKHFTFDFVELPSEQEFQDIECNDKYSETFSDRDSFHTGHEMQNSIAEKVNNDGEEICVNKILSLLENECSSSSQEINNESVKVSDDSLPFTKTSADVKLQQSRVPVREESAADEGRHRLMLPRASKRSVSPAISSSASDEGCSIAPPPESSLTPYSSEDELIKKLVDKPGGKSGVRWTWPPIISDQDIEGQGRVQRHDYGRCGSSDSAVCLLPSDEERRILKDPSGNRQSSIDSDILDLISEDPSCDKAMLFDRYMRKNSPYSDHFDNSQYFWSDVLSPKGTRRDSDVFESVSRQNSVDLGGRRDVWFEEMRNTKETVCDDVCDSGIDRDVFLNSAGDSCWDVSSADAKNDDSFIVGSDRNKFRGPSDDGFPCRPRPKHFRKLTSMISCESGVVEDEDCSRKSSTAENLEQLEDDEYPVELRRQSTQSFQTDDDDSSANPNYRYWRTPSVVVSDYSDDIPYFTSVTLEELEQLRSDEVLHHPRDLSSSECGSNRSSISGSVNVSALDADYALRTPERKASDCSTCSTLSGDEDANCDALLQPVRTKQKVGILTCI
ncbi:hypothetical protein C0J52_04393 [Blattella germanica]|nr:hypothetical protein C0J52_04393 [Blattella germanica]